jgi:hypothetical protein
MCVSCYLCMYNEQSRLSAAQNHQYSELEVNAQPQSETLSKGCLLRMIAIFSCVIVVLAVILLLSAFLEIAVAIEIELTCKDSKCSTRIDIGSSG